MVEKGVTAFVWDRIGATPSDSGTGEQLNDWLCRVKASKIRELQGFLKEFRANPTKFMQIRVKLF